VLVLYHVQQLIMLLRRLHLGHALSGNGVCGIVAMLSNPLLTVLIELVPLGCLVRPVIGLLGQPFLDISELFQLGVTKVVVYQAQLPGNLGLCEPPPHEAVPGGGLHCMVLLD